jgi:hypothetical protein
MVQGLEDKVRSPPKLKRRPIARTPFVQSTRFTETAATPTLSLLHLQYQGSPLTALLEILTTQSAAGIHQNG